MNQALSKEKLKTLLQSEKIDDLPLKELVQLVEAEPGLNTYKPDGICQIDPRSNARIIFNTARAKRPHDNIPEANEVKTPEKPCVICEGKTTGVIDAADLSEGFTFINKNLFPIFYPETPHEHKGEWCFLRESFDSKGFISYGLHFLQWTSSIHDKDWHNMSLKDRLIVLNRLAVLEKKLLEESGIWMPSSQEWDDPKERHGFISIIKNHGSLVGGSLAHGHQQIGFSDIMPKRFHDDWKFHRDKGEYFTTYLLRENPTELTVKDYGSAVLVVPYFMRRPYNMMLVLKDTQKRYLHELSAKELQSVAAGWYDGIRAIMQILPLFGKELAYNVTTHNGPGAGLYFEFLPYTQEMGGFEHLGLHVCQGNPQSAAKNLKNILEQE